MRRTAKGILLPETETEANQAIKREAQIAEETGTADQAVRNLAESMEQKAALSQVWGNAGIVLLVLHAETPAELNGEWSLRYDGDSAPQAFVYLWHWAELELPPGQVRVVPPAMARSHPEQLALQILQTLKTAEEQRKAQAHEDPSEVDA